MKKTDLTRLYKSYYTAKPAPALVKIEPASFLSLTGKGDPSGKEFTNNIQALYAVAYAVKFRYKAEGQDFAVSKLEGLWWFDMERYAHLSMAEAPVKIPRQEWEYRLLIRIPEYVDPEPVQRVKQAVVAQKGLPLAQDVVYYQMEEGTSVQVLHTGPFATEPTTLQKLADFMQQHALSHNGLHHEIYLSDFRKTPPEKLKTILRAPVKQANEALIKKNHLLMAAERQNI